jgi:hypothetical protein
MASAREKRRRNASLRLQYPLRRTRRAPPGQSTSERLVGDSVSKGMGAVKSSRKSIALVGRPLRPHRITSSFKPYSWRSVARRKSPKNAVGTQHKFRDATKNRPLGQPDRRSRVICETMGTTDAMPWLFEPSTLRSWWRHCLLSARQICRTIYRPCLAPA